MGFFAIVFTCSFFRAPFADNPRKTSAPFIASSSILNFVSFAYLDFHWSIPPDLPLYITPFLSNIIIFSLLTPEFLKSSVHAWADAPAPFTTTFISLIDLPLISRAFIKAAVVMIAVPCWSSWKTGISNISLSFCSIIKQSGAAISSRFIPPKLGAKFLIELIISSASVESISRSIESISANLLNKTALPSITGFDARAPKLPIPKIAEPLLITATKFPLLV